MKKTLLAEAHEVAAWMKNYALNSGRKSWVVGVSGGVDSALSSTLCALTGLPTHCVTMPCQTKPDQTDRGGKHIDWLIKTFGHDVVKYHQIDLTDTFESFAVEVADKYENELAFANTKSRLRMVALYQVACVYDGLVVGTGNKVEDFGIGFFTKYGDGGVDISPIADFLKSEVREMCKQLGVLPELYNAVPTDGLWDDTRTDESAIGATYDELEWAMKYADDEYKNDYAKLTPRQQEVFNIYMKRHIAGAHKLTPIPTYQRQETFLGLPVTP